MPAAHPKEFRDDVVAVARRGEAPIAQLAKDFGISESCLRNWLHQADVEDGHRPGVTKAENEELREARKKIRLLEQAPVLSRRVYPTGRFLRHALGPPEMDKTSLRLSRRRATLGT